MESNQNINRHPSQASSATGMTSCSQSYADFTVLRKNWEHPVDIKHKDKKADCSFLDTASSSSFSSYNPRPLLDRAMIFPQPHVNLKSPMSPPAAAAPRRAPSFHRSPSPAKVRRAPSFHPIPDADATAIPIDLSRGISDYNLMGPFCWSSNHDADCIPYFSAPSSSSVIIEEKHLNLVPSRDQHASTREEQYKAKAIMIVPVDTAAAPPLAPNNLQQQEPTSSLRVPKRKFDGLSQQHQQSTPKNNKHQQRNKMKPKRISPCPTKTKPAPRPTSSTTMLEEEEKQVEIYKKGNVLPAVFPDEVLSKTTPARNEDVSLPGSPSQEPRSSQAGNYRLSHVEYWTSMFKEATEFKMRYGHCTIPSTYLPNPRFARWAKRQRHQYRLLTNIGMQGRCTMTKERVRALDTLGFCWDINKAIWDSRYRELKLFRENNGHANVPHNCPENRKLQLWVKCQRNHYSKRFQSGEHSINGSRITPDRIELLNKLDFRWKVKA